MHMYMHTLFLQREIGKERERKGEGERERVKGEKVTHTMYTCIILCMLCTLVYMMMCKHGIVT